MSEDPDDTLDDLLESAMRTGKREAAAALGKWLRHDDGCDFAQKVAQDHGQVAVCRCGLSAALESLNG